MKIAIKKDRTSFGQNYFLYPRKIELSEMETFGERGFAIVEIEDRRAERLIRESSSALAHQIEIGDIIEMEIGKRDDYF